MQKYRIVVENPSPEILSFYVLFQGPGRRHFLFDVPYRFSVHSFFRYPVSDGQLRSFSKWYSKRLSLLIPRVTKQVAYVSKYCL